MAHTESQPIMPAAAEPVRTNWAGNYTYNAAHLVSPVSAEATQGLVPATGHVKAVGTRHSFNHIADTADTQFSLAQLRSMALDKESNTVTIGAGVTYGELAPWLDAQGFALHNLASLPHISVAGACATATHGSGLANRCLAGAVSGMEMALANGDLVSLTRAKDPELFPLAVVGLGALGVITSLTLDVVPTFEIAQTVYENLSFEELGSNLREIYSAAYSVSLFTNWQGHRVAQAWLKDKVAPTGRTAILESFYGARRQREKLHPLPGMGAEHCTEQLGVPGRWYERLPHFRLDYTPSAGAELQSEYFVPFEQGFDAILAVEQLRDLITPHLIVSELRAIAADELPLSMCSGRESLAIHFTWKQEIDAVRAVLPHIEAQLEPFAARPHWAKLFTMPPAKVRSLYPHFRDFEQVVHQLDPQGRFRNEFLRELLGT